MGVVQKSMILNFIMGDKMNFSEFKLWTKENGIEFKLNAIGGCMVDMISFTIDGKEIYTTDYGIDMNYNEIKDHLIKIIRKQH